MPNTLPKMNPAPKRVVLCSDSISLGISVDLKYFSSFSLIVLVAPINTNTTSVLTFHSFCNSIFRARYFFIFSRFFMLLFWSPGTRVPSILLTHTRSGLLSFYFLFILDNNNPEKFAFFLF